VIHLDVPDSTLVARLTARRQCPKCLKIYNLQSQRPRTAGYCDDDGSGLLTREDDQESVIRDRLYAYSRSPVRFSNGTGMRVSTPWTGPGAGAGGALDRRGCIEATGTIPRAARY